MHGFNVPGTDAGYWGLMGTASNIVCPCIQIKDDDTVTVGQVIANIDTGTPAAWHAVLLPSTPVLGRHVACCPGWQRVRHSIPCVHTLWR